MSTIIINNTEFTFNEGCRLLKLKYKECPKQFQNVLGDMWNDIEPITFKEVVKTFKSIEKRRIAIGCMGIERIRKELKPKLINTKTLKKETTWVTPSGELVKKKFNDTYELYKVSGKDWSQGITGNISWTKDVHFVKCKDTSTDREYFIWVDAESVYRTNDTRDQRWYSSSEDYGKLINPIQAIAWTIQTDVPEGNIKKIIRQGDCILIQPINDERCETRHLKDYEYLKLLVLES